MKARTLNRLIAATIALALCGNALIEYTGWTLAGTIFGWLLIVGTLYAVVDNKLKEREQL